MEKKEYRTRRKKFNSDSETWRWKFDGYGIDGCSLSGELVFIQPKMDRWVYLDIIKNNLKSDAAKLKLGNNWIFQQDRDPKHTAYVVKSWLLYNVPKQLHSPPNHQTLTL